MPEGDEDEARRQFNELKRKKEALEMEKAMLEKNMKELIASGSISPPPQEELKSSIINDDLLGNSDPQIALSQAISTLALSSMTKPPKFKKGESFAKHCDRFLDYIRITRQERNASKDILFLQNVDDVTYGKLSQVTLSQWDIVDTKAMLMEFKRKYYGGNSAFLKERLQQSKQLQSESIEQYAMRLREIADVAYQGDNELVNDNCFIAFRKGIFKDTIRRKVAESMIDTFDSALKFAMHLELTDSHFKENQQEVVEVSQVLTSSSMMDTPSESDKTPVSKSRERYSHRDQSRDRFRGRSRDRSQGRSKDRSRGRDYRETSHRSDRQSRGRERSNSRGRDRSKSWEKRSSTPRPCSRFNERRCYNCYKPGHFARECRNTSVRFQTDCCNHPVDHTHGIGSQDCSHTCSHMVPTSNSPNSLN